jgi:hypothetical protein
VIDSSSVPPNTDAPKVDLANIMNQGEEKGDNSELDNLSEDIFQFLALSI